MKKINITRDSTGKVKFETVSIDSTENVCFANLDPQAAHWPTLADNQLGPAPSPNSNQCIVPPPGTGKIEITYGCKIEGHESERGVIAVFPQLTAVNTTLKPATKGSPIAEQQVVAGGASPYEIFRERFEVKDSDGNVVQSGAGAGPGLQLKARFDHTGIWLAGTPTVSGTYNFVLMVNDAMGRNLQQRYSMVVA